MFEKGLLNSLGQAKPISYQAGHLLPSLSARKLLAAGRHQGLLHSLRQITGISKQDFDRLYQSTIDRFVEFVQVLPSQNNAALCGLMNEGLARGTVALQTMISQQGKTVDHLLNFAAFTAGLFLDVSKTVMNQQVILTDEQGEYSSDWDPFAGAMAQGEFYKLYPLSSALQRLDNVIKPMLARQIMPPVAFQWLTADLQVFADWLDALTGDRAQGGRLAHTLGLMPLEDILDLINTLVQVPLDLRESSANQYGEQFFQWLVDALNNNDIKVNSADGGVHVVDEGLFIEEKLFKQYAEMMKIPVNDKVVFAEFGNMFGIVQDSGQNVRASRYARGMDGGKVLAAVTGRFSMQQTALLFGLVMSPLLVHGMAQYPQLSSLHVAQARSITSHQLPVERRMASAELKTKA